MKTWPTTRSDSSARTSSISPASYDGQDDRITVTSKEGQTGARPIKTSAEVKYKQYENDKRMTEDFAMAGENSDKTANFDGAKTATPEPDDNRSDINTSQSE